MGSAAVVIDYQNLHLTAHGRFCASGAPVHECLIHPLYFANTVLTARTTQLRQQGSDDGELFVGAVLVYRGLPDSRKQPKQNRRSQLQKTEWSRDPKVKVDYRPLRYQTDNHSNQWTAQEKGVDVMIALNFVALIQQGQHEVVILATHDTDLEPAMSFAHNAESVRDGRVRVETTGWSGCKRIGRSARHSFLGKEDRDRAIDRTDYR